MAQTPILIITHGPFGQYLIESSEMIFGKLEDVTAIGLQEGQEPEDYANKVGEYLDANPNALVLVDLFGGTPCNTILRFAMERPVLAMTGVNLPMLVEAATQRMDLEGEELLNALEEAMTGTQVNITKMVQNR